MDPPHPSAPDTTDGPGPSPGPTPPTSGAIPGDDLQPPPLLLPIPGTEPRRRLRPRMDWDLLACGLHGHVLPGADAAAVGQEHASFVRQAHGTRWCRCLRCEGWVPLAAPATPTAALPPAPGDLQLPVRGARLRDRYVLRLIVVDRAVHILVLAALAVAVFLFAANRPALHRTFIRILNGLQDGFGGPSGTVHSGIVGDVNRLFALPQGTVYLIGVAVSCYTAVLVAEAVGLWRARRWAEYLTLVETGILVPFELYELAGGISALKVLSLVINLAIVLYLLLAHRLFGLRGGYRQAVARYGDSG